MIHLPFFLTFAVGLLQSCIALPSESSTSVEQPSSEATDASEIFEIRSRWSNIADYDYSGKRADRAEVAGMMATFTMEPYKASYIFIVNEYGGDELVRQNGCAYVLNSMSKYDMLFVSIIFLFVQFNELV